LGTRMSEHVSDLIDRELGEYVRERFDELLAYYTKRLHNLLIGYLNGAVNDFRKKFKVYVVCSYSAELEPPRVSLRVDVEIPPYEVQRMWRAYTRTLASRREAVKLRIDLIYKYITKFIDEIVEEVEGVQPGLRPGPGEGHEEAGGGGAQVRDQEGGPAA